MEFSKDVKKFYVEGIPIVGKFSNNQVVGLTEEGEKIVNYIEQNGEYPSFLSENAQILINTLEENNFFEQGKKEKKLKSAYLHVTDHCNLHCKGCYSYVSARNTQQELCLEDYKRIIDKLLAAGVEAIVISGGEPLVRDDIGKICEYAKIKGIENLQLISNGTMPFSRYDEIFPVVDKLTISIDGYDEEVSYLRDKGIFPIIMQTITYCKKHINTTFVATLHKKNCNYSVQDCAFTAQSVRKPR